MPSSTHHDYDENLLVVAPKPDKRQIQEGYNADLLKEKPQKPQKASPATPATPSRDPEAAIASREPSVVPLPAKKPFYRSKKGIIVIAVIIIAVLIAAIVGGVVGSKKKTSNDNTSAPGNGVGSTAIHSGTVTQSQGQGGGPVTVSDGPSRTISTTTPPPTSVTTTQAQQQGGPSA